MKKPTATREFASAAASRSGPERPLISPRARQAVLGAMCLSLVLVVASVAMLNVALRDIALDLGPTQAELQWIVDAYVLLLAALLLPFGALGDRYGRRSALLVGIVIFGVASAAAAMAGSRRNSSCGAQSRESVLR